MRPRIDLTGNRYGMLKVVSMAEQEKSGIILWLCKCECGGVKVVSTRYLRDRKVLSCGCKKRGRPMGWKANTEDKAKVKEAVEKIKAPAKLPNCQTAKLRAGKGEMTQGEAIAACREVGGGKQPWVPERRVIKIKKTAKEVGFLEAKQYLAAAVARRARL